MKNKPSTVLVAIWMIIIFIMSSFDSVESSNQSNFIVDIIANIFKIENIELLKRVVMTSKKLRQ